MPSPKLLTPLTSTPSPPSSLPPVGVSPLNFPSAIALARKTQSPSGRSTPSLHPYPPPPYLLLPPSPSPSPANSPPHTPDPLSVPSLTPSPLAPHHYISSLRVASSRGTADMGGALVVRVAAFLRTQYKSLATAPMKLPWCPKYA